MVKKEILVTLALGLLSGSGALAANPMRCISGNFQDNTSFAVISENEGEFKVWSAADGQNHSSVRGLDVSDMVCAPYEPVADSLRNTQSIVADCRGENSPVRILIIDSGPFAYNLQMIGGQTVVDLNCAK